MSGSLLPDVVSPNAASTQNVWKFTCLETDGFKSVWNVIYWFSFIEQVIFVVVNTVAYRPTSKIMSSSTLAPDPKRSLNASST